MVSVPERSASSPMKYMGTTKKKMSQSRPGPRSQYGTRRCFRLICQLTRSARPARPRRPLRRPAASPGSSSSSGTPAVGKTSGSFASSGFDQVLDPFDRRDVGDVFGQVGRHLGLVDELHPAERGGRVRRPDRDHHVVRPEHAALGRHPPFGVLVLDDRGVARPADRGDDVAGGQVLGVVVAGEARGSARSRRPP